MTLYSMIGSAVGTPHASTLGARLSAWHDAMVSHERRLQAGSGSASCHDECPHAEAPALWAQALEAFGPRAAELTFLRSRAMHVPLATRMD